MNVDQQQLPPPPPALLNADGYANYSIGSGTSSSTTATTAEPEDAATTTYVNIPIMSMTAASMSTAAGATTPVGGGTSTFKTTTLLPMPSLEDIEVGMGMMPPGSALQQQQPIPGGILKYPTNTTTISMSLPMVSMVGPGPPTVSQQQLMQQPPATLVINNDTVASCGTLKSSAKLMHTSAPPPTLVGPLTTLPPAVGLMNTSSMTLGNIAAGSNNCNATANINTATNLTGNAALPPPGTSRSNSNSNGSRQKPPASKCCACFGSSGRGGDAAPSSAGKSTKKRKQKTQTLWSALITNLGICGLLLAYTLLGSFIFLTIESEDSSLLHQQQRILASTKRVGGSLMAGHSAGIGGGNSENIYHTSQQMQRLDNGTLTAAVASSTLSSSSSSTSSSSSASQQSVLEGIVPLSNGNNDDFIYGGVDDASSAQFALSADTYDVRQRTIENIWDITVSLNILYKENWTKLAALEIAKFQDQLIKRLNEDALLQLSHDMDGATGNSPATEAVLLHTHQHGHHGAHEWNFAKAFLYSLTVLTTIGYGNIAPRTTLGRLVTLVYAIFGIPLTLVYLSSTGGILAKVAREVFSKALCCCLCSNCGYCCYDEKRMAEKERRMKRKRQQEELRKQQAAMQEPYYVRSGSMHDAFQTPEKQTPCTPASGATASGQLPPDIDSLSASESRGSMHGLSILAPILLCLSMMIIYIVFGAVVLYRLENWPLLDGIYFCFMSLSTIGFGDMLPGLRRESTTTTWFCSIYIMSGMALTAMCFNVIHEEIVHRIKIVVEFKKGATLDSTSEDQSYYMPP